MSSQWGTNKIGNTILPFLATINTPINPQGYFSTSRSLNWYGQYEAGLADDMSFAQLEGAPDTQDSDGLNVISPPLSVKKAIPFFVGPDGLRDTADDLPFVKENANASSAGYTLAAPIAGTPSDRFDRIQTINGIAIPVYSETAQINVPTASDPSVTKLVELYGVYNPKYVTGQGCGRSGLNATFNRTTGVCTDAAGNDITAAALARGCPVLTTANKGQSTPVGINADGDCIEVNTSSTGGTSRVQYEVLGLLSDLRSRPSQASNEPLDATDLRLYGNNGVQIPARPRSSSNGIVFQSPGAKNFYDTHRKVVSYLGEHWNEDQLQWNHGDSQQEHEFAEGYLEFEMFDSQLFARVGKQFVIWGKTEFYRNQDRANPVDIGNGIFAPFDEARVGQWAVDVTLSPEAFMRVGPVEDMRLELLWIMNQFTPTDIGKCGEGASVELICLRSFGAMANGLAGLGLLGESRPTKDQHGLATYDYGARVEGRLDRFTFSVSDFWGWDDGSILNLQQQYERTADFSTGAPLSTDQQRHGGHCTIRTNAAGQAVGPNGIAGDGDDDVAERGQLPSLGQARRDRTAAPEVARGDRRRAAGEPDPVPLGLRLHLRPGRGLLRVRPPQQPRYVRLHLRDPRRARWTRRHRSRRHRDDPRGDQPVGFHRVAQQLTSEFKLSQFMAVNPKGIQDQTAQDLGVNCRPTKRRCSAAARPTRTRVASSRRSRGTRTRRSPRSDARPERYGAEASAAST